jgi:hypothetical protein
MVFRKKQGTGGSEMPKIVDENNVQIFPELNQEPEEVSGTKKKIAIFIVTDHAWVVLDVKQWILEWILDLISTINNRSDDIDSIEKAKDACDKLDIILDGKQRFKSRTIISGIDFAWFYQDEW